MMKNDLIEYSAKLEVKKRLKLLLVCLLMLIGAILIKSNFSQYFTGNALEYLLYIASFILILDLSHIWYRYKKNMYGTSIYEYLEVINNNSKRKRN